MILLGSPVVVMQIGLSQAKILVSRIDLLRCKTKRELRHNIVTITIETVDT